MRNSAKIKKILGISAIVCVDIILLVYIVHLHNDSWPSSPDLHLQAVRPVLRTESITESDTDKMDSVSPHRRSGDSLKGFKSTQPFFPNKIKAVSVWPDSQQEEVHAQNPAVPEPSLPIQEPPVMIEKKDKTGNGFLHIYSYPWSDIYVDSVFQGTSPTSRLLSLSPGQHSIELQRAGYKKYCQVVHATSGEVVHIKINLDKLE
jgi:hypothetical protein